MTAQECRQAVARQLVIEVGQMRREGRLSQMDADRLRTRARRLGFCGALIAARVCGGCDKPRPGSGALCVACGSRTCPGCERQRSRAQRRALEHALTKLLQAGVPRGWELVMITQTVERDPLDPDDHTVEALAGRHDALQRGWRRAWERGEAYTLKEWQALTVDQRLALIEAHYERVAERAGQRAADRAARGKRDHGKRSGRKREATSGGKEARAAGQRAKERAAKRNAEQRQALLDAIERGRDQKWGGWREIQPVLGVGHRLGVEGAAAYWHPECASAGHVHAHALYLGPWIDKAWLDRVMAREACGFTDVKVLGGGLSRDRRGVSGPIRKGIKEVAKYVSKACSVLSTRWMAGERDGRKKVLHPVIAARWEIALLGVRTSRVYGALVGLMGDQEDEGKAEGSSQKRPDEDAEVACECCGCVGDWRWEIVGTQTYARYSRARGKSAVVEVLPYGSKRWQDIAAAVAARAEARARARCSEVTAA